MKTEHLVLGLFCTVLLGSLVLGLPLVGALLAGLAIFLGYGRHQGLRWRQLLSMAASGVWQARKILLIFFLIGTLSAVWRCSGTIATLVCYCGTLVHPSYFLLAAFVLCGLVSFLTGTSFGTSATMGVICMAMGTAIGMPTVAVGGAILSGAFFGDRCSPVSSSALLVADVTGTDIYRNVRLMMKTALIPLLMTCACYVVLGLSMPHEGTLPDMRSMFAGEFVLHPLTLLPAALILLLSLMHVDVRLSLTAGILAALPLCLTMQHTAPGELLSCIVNGFHAVNPQVAAVLDGGGVLSMVRVASIVCISAAYSGIFRHTRLLDGVRRGIDAIAVRTSPFFAMLLTSVVGSAISCNQSLTIMLTNQLCENCQPDSQQRAIDLENTAVVVAPLIPWSIAGSVPLTTVGAPMSSIFFAIYLFLIPLWSLLMSLRRKPKRAM